MTRSTSARVYRRQVKKGMIEEIKRRTGRDTSSSSVVREMLQERIEQKEREKALPDITIPEQQ